MFLLWCCTDSRCEANVPTGSQFMFAMVLYKQRLWSAQVIMQSVRFVCFAVQTVVLLD